MDWLINSALNFAKVVYFKMASQPLLRPLREQAAPEAFEFKPVSSSTSTEAPPCLCVYSNSVLASLEALYSAELFLPPLVDKCWQFSLQRMQDYLGWAQAMLDHFLAFSLPKEAQPQSSNPTTATTTTMTTTNLAMTAAAAESGGGRRSASPRPARDRSPIEPASATGAATALQPAPPTWLSLAALCRDLQLFDAQLFQFCLSTIWTHLRLLRVDPTPFGQCLSLFSEQLAIKRTAVQTALVELLGTELAKSLAAVSDIPRQYRWTKRPQPVGFSAYLATAFTLGELFREETTTKLGWEPAEQGQVLGQAVGRAAGDFCERAEKVLDAVEQTGSSLLRFKQRKAAAGGGQQQQQAEEAATESDEAKIRAQLCYDANFVRQRLQEFDATIMQPAGIVQRLERIEQRAANANAPAAAANGRGGSPAAAPVALD